jgi:tRNA threonylcarbamoyl adenosine modification protein YeaZ
MLHLCADSSGSELCFTLAENKVLRAETRIQAGRKMNELFVIALDQFLLDNAFSIRDVGHFTAITGPGSFTGVRIGISALTGITEALGRRFTGLSALDAAALLSGKERVSVAARLKPGEYAVKTYDFAAALFGKAEVMLNGQLPADCIFVNSGAENTPGSEVLTSAVLLPGCELFLGEPAPEYIRPSEAELNFDKK